MAEMKQHLELRHILAPELRQSLSILTLQLLDLNQLIEQELLTNPVLEESAKTTETSEEPPSSLPEPLEGLSRLNAANRESHQKSDFIAEIIAQKVTLQDVLLRQLGMFAEADEELRVGQEIIGNLDENGYLKTPLEEISSSLQVSIEICEKALKLVQQFEPFGVGARTISECLLIQLQMLNDPDLLLREIITNHLDDVAKKNHSRIAKALHQPLEQIELLIKKLHKLDPKPGRNYSVDNAQRIIPDIIIEELEETKELQITINNDYIPRLSINHLYKQMLKKSDLDPKTREFITAKLRNAMELIRAVSKRQSTLRRVIEAIVEIQKDAIKEDLSLLRPLTFNEIAVRLNLHESTISRVIMNKYAQTPCGTIALKNFFSSRIQSADGNAISSTLTKSLIKELIEQENKKKPLSDQEIITILQKQHGLTLARRTVAKYRQELKILSTEFRRER